MAAEGKKGHDFTVASPKLDVQSREWLLHALALIDPGHPWIDQIEQS
jgi:hypothetical protein